MIKRTAIVIGATGLVGIELVQLLLEDERFESVKVLARRATGLHQPKLQEHIVDFGQPAQWQHLVTGDVLFSTLGTTLKTAGSKAAQYKVDHGYQFHTAQAASVNGIPVYVLLSSAMADPHSRLFYTRMKGELERDVKRLPFRYIHILQPGMLEGNRKESRPGEKTILPLLHFLNRLGLFKKQRPIPVTTVARAMIHISFRETEAVITYDLERIFAEAGA